MMQEAAISVAGKGSYSGVLILVENAMSLQQQGCEAPPQ